MPIFKKFRTTEFWSTEKISSLEDIQKDLKTETKWGKIFTNIYSKLKIKKKEKEKIMKFFEKTAISTKLITRASEKAVYTASRAASRVNKLFDSSVNKEKSIEALKNLTKKRHIQFRKFNQELQKRDRFEKMI